MTTLEIVLVFFLLIATAVAVIAIYFAVRFGMMILKVEDGIEESLDILDIRYESIAKIIEIPLFSDSPQIRQVHQDLKYSRDALISVANILVGDFKRLKEEDIDDGPTT